MKQYIGIDQYGECFLNLGNTPRKSLIDSIGNQHVEKMYIDTKEGKPNHIGYIIGNHWIKLYEIKPFKKLVK